MQPDSHLSSILIVEDSQGRRKIVLENPIYSMGRDAKCDIRVASLFMSRHHATLIQISQDDGTSHYRILDGNLEGKASSNGILINGRKLKTHHDLTNEDEIVFGPQARAIYYQLQRASGANTPRNPRPVDPELGTKAISDDEIRGLP
ncbi:fha domain-containing protein [Leptolyngbya sp. Heron Island J]|uniref:FHA domain-containing protein n=1 Tax=Leptolyngbya sp. Heron Island J TaxID=1385935 RepID=UPI0003B9A400|nr:FHA domain-containing protein [Leptolyngbya sp. Heron Island J]ESA32222.1 fha domain-containing protein [Leptolyngbya sp. Heron Island J]